MNHFGWGAYFRKVDRSNKNENNVLFLPFPPCVDCKLMEIPSQNLRFKHIPPSYHQTQALLPNTAECYLVCREQLYSVDRSNKSTFNSNWKRFHYNFLNIGLSIQNKQNIQYPALDLLFF